MGQLGWYHLWEEGENYNFTVRESEAVRLKVIERKPNYIIAQTMNVAEQTVKNLLQVAGVKVKAVDRVMARKTILIDFDGVLHDYKGWTGPEPKGAPIANSRHACCILQKQFRLVCFTTRDAELTKQWLRKHAFPEMKVTNVKEAAFLIIDDRAVCFQGVWSDEFLASIKSFRPHWESNDDLGSELAEHIQPKEGAGDDTNDSAASSGVD